MYTHAMPEIHLILMKHEPLLRLLMCGFFKSYNPYTNTNKEKIGSFFSRALAYEVNRVLT